METERKEIFLPNEVLIPTFSYLEVADVRSCRLVCRQWYFCCQDKMITRAEKFVFCSDINLTSEINEFFINLGRRVNVELVRIDLSELNFELFGSNIEELELKDCIIDVDTFKNLFYATPNMTRFCMSTDVTPESGYESPPGWSDVEVWVRGVNLLHEEKFQNFNMKEFKWNVHYKGATDRFGFRLSHFFFIFPCVQSIHLWDTFTTPVIPELRNLPTTNMTYLGGTFVINLDMIDQSETFASFSRLKSLDLGVRFFVQNRLSLGLCERLFSQMAELEELSCKLCTCKENDALTVRGELAKEVLFQILKSCLKLTKLSFTTFITDTPIYLNRDEMLEFTSSIKKMKNLRLPKLMIGKDIGEPLFALSDTGGILKDLDFEIFCGPSDVGYRIMETYQLTALKLTIDQKYFCMNLEKILQSQKCLQRLEIRIITEYPCESTMDSNLKEFITLKHERLNHFVYMFRGYGEDWPKVHFLRLFTCELPNLRTLKLSTGLDIYDENESEDDNSDSGLKNFFRMWLGKMTTLTQICVRVHRYLLNFEECVEVFGKMRHLQMIVWISQDSSSRNPSKEVINLFLLLPYLKSIHYRPEKFTMEIWTYKYHRSKKQLFLRNDVEDSCNLVLVN